MPMDKLVGYKFQVQKGREAASGCISFSLHRQPCFDEQEEAIRAALQIPMSRVIRMAVYKRGVVKSPREVEMCKRANPHVLPNYFDALMEPTYNVADGVVWNNDETPISLMSLMTQEREKHPAGGFLLKYSEWEGVWGEEGGGWDE